MRRHAGWMVDIDGVVFASELFLPSLYESDTGPYGHYAAMYT
jgi:hypothetical protein